MTILRLLLEAVLYGHKADARFLSSKLYSVVRGGFVMDLNPTLALTRDLAKAVIARKALIQSGAPLTDFMVMALDKRAGILADDLQAAIDAPQSFQPWTPHNSGNTK